MKRYNIYFSFTNLLSESQSEVVKLQQLFKGFTASITLGTWYGADADHAIWVGMAGFVVDILLGCFYFELKNVTPDGK